MSEKHDFLEDHREDTNFERNSSPRKRRNAVILIVLLIGSLLYSFGLPSPSLLQSEKNKRHSLRHKAEKILKAHPLIDGHEDFLISLRARYNNHLYSTNFTKLFEKGGLQGQLDVPRIKEGHYGGTVNICVIVIVELTVPRRFLECFLALSGGYLRFLG
jgi:hypothetical protein